MIFLANPVVDVKEDGGLSLYFLRIAFGYSVSFVVLCKF